MGLFIHCDKSYEDNKDRVPLGLTKVRGKQCNRSSNNALSYPRILV